MSATLVGTPVTRVDGRKKVTGAAQYASEFLLGDMAHGVLVGSAIPSGRVTAIDARAAEQAPGVLLVLTHENCEKLRDMPQGLEEGGATSETRKPLEDDQIHYAGQAIAMVVAETLEQARHAAALLLVGYDPREFAVDMETGAKSSFRPKQWLHESLTFRRGNVDLALSSAVASIDETYRTPPEHPCALEPHAAIASWSEGVLTIYNSSQWVMGDSTVLQKAFGLAAAKVRVLCPFTGGMFGSKGSLAAHALLAAVASKQLARPVKVVMTRTQVLREIGHRPGTIQRIELAATDDGTITALRHRIRSHTSIKDDFVEFASVASRMLYSIPNYETDHEVIRLNVVKPGWMRAPGEAPGQFALESALDELSYRLSIDPVELRRKNHAESNLQLNKPFSSKHLLECYDRGAERFEWNKRKPEPRSMRDGSALVGYGMATATYPGYLMGAQVKVRLENGEQGAQAIVSTAGCEVGTGMYTMLAIVAADELGLRLESVHVEMGDSHYSPCAVAGGSNLTASTAPATKDACISIRKGLLKIAAKTADGFTGAEGHEEEFLFQDGALSHRSSPASKIRYETLLSSSGRKFIEGEGQTKPIFGQNDRFAFQSFGAHFVEVRVHQDIGRIRVSRVVSVFDCGKIMSGKTTRSQFIGGVTFGIGQALMEELTYDPHTGKAVNADLAGYLLPVHADVPQMDISWIGEPDLNFNSVGCRGVGEIGITGVAAAIANAVYHATGARIRDLPITPEKLLPSAL